MPTSQISYSCKSSSLTASSGKALLFNRSTLPIFVPLLCSNEKSYSYSSIAHLANFPCMFVVTFKADSVLLSVTNLNDFPCRYYLSFPSAQTAANNSPSALPYLHSVPRHALDLKLIGTSTPLWTWCRVAAIPLANQSVYNTKSPSSVGKCKEG